MCPHIGVDVYEELGERRGGDAARMSSATATIAAVPPANPAMTPSTSAMLRFWLSLRLPSMRVIDTSIPTMPRNIDSMYSDGASVTAYGVSRVDS